MQGVRRQQRAAAATSIQRVARGRRARAAKPTQPAAVLAWAVREAIGDKEEAAAAASTLAVVVDRERVCSDILNTSVMAALVGGFALSNMQSPLDPTPLEHTIYLASCLAVHACTCSALTSALLYRVAVRMHDDAIPAWAARNRVLLTLPLAKFGMGCVSYLASVVLLSFRDLSESVAFQYAGLAIGLMSMSTVFATVGIIATQQQREQRQHAAGTRIARVAPHSV
jgi:hypothetical protein